MRVSINLATRPYVELGPVYKRLRLLILAFALLAAPLWLLLHAETGKADAAQARLAASQQRLNNLQRQEQGYQSAMRQPQNASVLRQSQFLNAVFEHKAFSWTAVMMDLEKVLPGGVQVESIDPTISRDGSVTIRLRVSGEHDRAVDLVRNLEHSNRFLSPRLADEAAETASQGGRGLEQVSNNNGVNLDILADYNPLPVAGETKSGQSSTAKVAAKSAAGNAGRTGAKPASRRHRANSARPSGAQPPPPGLAPHKEGPR